MELGYVARAHGIRGELRVILHNPESETLASVDRVVIGREEFEVAGVRPTKGAMLLAVVGLDDRDRAEAMRGQVVSVARELIELGEGEYLLGDLVGCQAVLDTGAVYGTVTAVEPGSQDRLVIVHGDIERLLPLVPELVREIDLDGRRIVVEPPSGLPEYRARKR